jgi:hypothetical protein
LQDVARSAESFHAKGTLILLSLGGCSHLGQAIFQRVFFGKDIATIWYKHSIKSSGSPAGARFEQTNS